MEIKYKRDTSFRKNFFVPDSFAHPAKMDAQLLIWLVERYTKEGDVILDPMAGSGTLMLACTLGRNCVLVELEEKFCKMCRDNWEQVKMRPQLGSTMGWCEIRQGDARNLEQVLRNMSDCIITSPPYADAERRDRSKENWWDEDREKKFSGGSAKISKGYQADSIITSPPYAETSDACKMNEEFIRKAEQKHKRSFSKRTFSQYNEMPDSKDNLGNLSYGDIDAVIASPPYEATVTQGGDTGAHKAKYGYQGENIGYAEAKNNIGNLKSQSYLEAMLTVYKNCFAVLKPQGLMILVTKNFIRNKQVVRLDTDTIKLCEQAGFKFIERHYRKLPSQSFWRVIYHQKHPEVEQILYEDVLVFSKV